MLELLRQPWHWSISGLLIGLTVPTLLILGNKSFGISSSLRHICAACVPANIDFFNYDWKKESWNLFFVLGVILGGFIGNTLLANPNEIIIVAQTKQDLMALGIKDFSGLMPTDLFNFQSLFTLKGFIFIVLGGFFLGFGANWAGGCTSGHCIMGISNLQLPSLIAITFFMIGGFMMAWFIIPFLLTL
jgi:uncharacterized membrane protein YedE/YeeE